MQDGQTRRIDNAKLAENDEFLQRHRVTLIVVSGPCSVNEIDLDKRSVSLGRGPGADVAFEDDAMSREHAAFELVEDGFRVRDLASTNGLEVNGSEVLVAELKHGDRVKLGETEFQYLQEKLSRGPKTYHVADGAD